MSTYQAVFQRKEVKYLLSDAQLAALMPILKAHMKPDVFPHSSISNLYYDTDDFRMIRRSLEKPQYKEKLRLRSYGIPGDGSMVFPEIKKKAQGIVYKRRVSMPYAQAISFLAGKSPAPEGQIYRELRWMLASYPHLTPKVFLSYERDSWQGIEQSALRLTLDREIHYRTERLDLQHDTSGNDILQPGQTLMEVKIPGAAPLWLSHALSALWIFPTSFSKYGEAYQRICKENEMEIKQYA